MSSREIAALVEKNHKDVLRDVRVMLDGLSITSAQFCAYIKVPMPRGGFRNEEVYLLPKDLTLIGSVLSASAEQGVCV